MSMCQVFSCVVGRGCLLWPVCSFGKTLLSFDLLCFVLQDQICPLLQVSLDFLFLSSIVKRASILGVSSRKLFIEPFNFSFFSIMGQGIDLDYCDIKWFALQTNRDHSFVFYIASKYCISDSFVDYDGYSVSSKGFFPTLVDIIAIWVKFTHSSPF